MDRHRAPQLHVDYFGQTHNEGHADVLTWQTEMAWRGWTIDVDQVFGPKSEEACRRFQAAQGLEADGLVGEATWEVTWATPVDQAEIDAMTETAADDGEEHES